jgi:queuine/archaeosine tRNA-ribosyltransferase
MSKMDVLEVYFLFKEIKESLKQRNDKPVNPAQIDVLAINSLTKQIEILIEKVRKPVKTEHRHIIDIGSSKVFFTMIAMGITILILSVAIHSQRQIIRQYRDNDLKYRYIKIQGDVSKDVILGLEKQFEYRDSVDVIRKQVEEYERLAKQQEERIERAMTNANETDKLQKQKENVRCVKKNFITFAL